MDIGSPGIDTLEGRVYWLAAMLFFGCATTVDYSRVQPRICNIQD